MENSVNLERIRAEYNVKHWSQGFYGIDDNGEVYVSPAYDQSEITALAGATIALELLYVWTANRLAKS
ncbi:hypothetical protein [Vibrio sp.]|uniref:hypothetical protein n=1 Tax=Vibrio sp. TaxID=678 RepID=UPI003F6CB870